MSLAPSRRQALGLLTALSLSLGAVPSLRAEQAAGKPAREIGLADLSGAPVKLSGLVGKVVVIDFFASWCEPCMRELPELEKLHRELAPAGVVFVGVNLDKERKNVEALVKRFGLSFSVVHDPDGKVAEAYDPPKMPSTYVVDKAGIVRHINAGFEGAADVAKLRKQVTSLNH